jgi:hypothetical protein
LSQCRTPASTRVTRAGYDRDAALGQEVFETPPERQRKHRQDLVRAGHEGKGEAAGIMSRLRHLAAQSPFQRQQQLDPARTGPDERDPRAAFLPAYTCDQRLQAGQECADRLHRDGVLRRPGRQAGIRRRAHIEGQGIVGHGRPVAADHPFIGQIEPDRRVVVETRAGEAGEWAGVDMGVIEAIEPGDEARQHAGVGRVQFAGDEGEAHAGQRLHAKAAQHGDICVARADQHHILDDRPCP